MNLNNCDSHRIDFNAETLKAVCLRLRSAGRSFLPANPGALDLKPGIAWADYLESLAYIKNTLMDLGREPVLFSREYEDYLVSYYLGKSGVKDDLWEGAKFGVIAFPCNTGGTLLTSSQIENNDFMSVLIKAGDTLRGFGSNSSQILRVLPNEIADSLMVEIGRYDQENPFPHLLSGNDKVMIENVIREAFKRSREKFDVDL